LSRCLQFNLKRLPVSQIAERIRHILEAENVPFDAAGVRLVAQAADGSMRDGLSLLDQVIAFGGGKVGENEARAMLGTVARDHVVRLAELLAAADPVELMRYVQSLEQWAPDYAQILEELASLLTRVAMKQMIADYEGDELYDPELLARLAKAFSAEDVQLYYQTAIIGRRDLELAPDARTGFEMTLLRMLAFRPVDAAEPAGASGARAPAAGAAGAQRMAAPQERAAAPARSNATTVAAPRASTPPPEGASWDSILANLELQGPARVLAINCALIGKNGPVVRLALDPRNQLVRTKAREEELAKALSRYYGETVRLEIEAQLPPGAETPAQAEQRALAEQTDSARQALEADPGLRALRERFGATVVPDSVRPLK
ncbi:MAG TPA: DNA polymerase III subunit gamma/tau C-terminal domain-containing protein, partial [Steroidobacteraceae bacterium]